MSDCRCPTGPRHDERGEKCVTCGGFACAYAGKGRTRCSSAICDCFIEQYPDSPFDLHPEAFTVRGHERTSATGVWQERPASESGDRVPCRVCGGLAYDLTDAHPLPPCAHGEALCGDCNLGPDGCMDCRLEAEQEMYRTGDYDPRKDPFHDHTAPKPVNRIERDGGYHWDGSWVEVNPQGHSA